MAPPDAYNPSRASTPHKPNLEMEEKRSDMTRRRSGAFKTEEEDIQGISARTSTPATQRDTPRKSLKRTTSTGDPKSPETKEENDKISGDITVKVEPGQAPKLSRSLSKRLPHRPAPKFLDLPDAGSEASQGFETLERCAYANKWIGITEPALECDCQEEWGKS